MEMRMRMRMEMKMAVVVVMEMEMVMAMVMEMVMVMVVMHCVIEHHNTQYAPVDAINRDNERSQPKRRHNGVRDAKVPERQHNGVRGAKVRAGWARRRRLRPLLLASTTKSAHTGAGATPRNWLPAGTDGPSTEQR
jgi:hypothetical protein